MALLTSAAGEGDADGEGLTVAIELELLPGSATQPAAAMIVSVMMSPRIVYLIRFILCLAYCVIGMTACLRRRFPCHYFVPGVLVLAEGDAAGEGLATELGVLTGALTVELGEGDAAAGLAVGVVASLTGSLAQPAANAIEVIVRRRSAVRLILFIFEVLITFCLVRARLKSGMMIARTLIASNGCSHRRKYEY